MPFDVSPTIYPVEVSFSFCFPDHFPIGYCRLKERQSYLEWEVGYTEDKPFYTKEYQRAKAELEKVNIEIEAKWADWEKEANA